MSKVRTFSFQNFYVLNKLLVGMKTERIFSVRSGKKRIRIPFGTDNSRIVRIQIQVFFHGYEYGYGIAVSVGYE